MQPGEVDWFEPPERLIERREPEWERYCRADDPGAQRWKGTMNTSYSFLSYACHELLAVTQSA